MKPRPDMAQIDAHLAQAREMPAPPRGNCVIAIVVLGVIAQIAFACGVIVGALL